MSDKPQNVANTAKVSADSLDKFVKQHWSQLSEADAGFLADTKHRSMTFTSLLDAERKNQFSKEEKHMLTLLESNTIVIGMLDANKPGEISQKAVDNLAQAAHGKLDPYKCEQLNFAHHAGSVYGLGFGIVTAVGLAGITIYTKQPLTVMSAGGEVGLMTVTGGLFGAVQGYEEYQKHYEPNLRSLMTKVK